MTIAGFEMLHGVAVQRAEELAAPAHPTDVATPQMEEARAGGDRDAACR